VRDVAPFFFPFFFIFFFIYAKEDFLKSLWRQCSKKVTLNINVTLSKESYRRREKMA
jgi:hypothetical protein